MPKQPPPALASAAKRLSESPPSGFPRRPGRPKKAGVETTPGPPKGSLTTVAPLAPRLLDITAASKYLGDLSEWTTRDLISSGHLRRVRLPLQNGGELRRVLVDVRDLDRLIETSKDAGP